MFSLRICTCFVAIFGMVHYGQAQVEEAEAVLQKRVQQMEELKMLTGPESSVYKLPDQSLQHVNKECCRREVHVVNVAVKGVTCAIKTYKCIGGCTTYSNDTSNVYLAHQATGAYITTLCPSETFFEGTKCCAPTQVQYQYAYCNGQTLYIQAPKTCDCGACDETQGKCFPQTNIDHHTIKSKYLTCTTLDKINLPYCRGYCQGSHSYWEGTLHPWGYTSKAEKKKCECCEKSEEATVDVKMKCTFQGCFGTTITYYPTGKLTKITKCECSPCSVVHPTIDQTGGSLVINNKRLLTASYLKERGISVVGGIKEALRDG